MQPGAKSPRASSIFRRRLTCEKHSRSKNRSPAPRSMPRRWACMKCISTASASAKIISRPDGRSTPSACITRPTTSRRCSSAATTRSVRFSATAGTPAILASAESVAHYGPHSRLLTQLDIEYADGSHDLVCSDGSWKATFGPIREADLLEGCTYDAHQELGAWDSAKFEDSSWQDVNVTDSVKPIVQASPGPRVQVMNELPAKAISEPLPHTYVFDPLAKNMSGLGEHQTFDYAGSENPTSIFRDAQSQWHALSQLRARCPVHRHVYFQRRRHHLGAEVYVSWLSLCRSHRRRSQAAARCDHRHRRAFADRADGLF